MFLRVNRTNFSSAIPLNCLTALRCGIFILLLSPLAERTKALGPEPGPGEAAHQWSFQGMSL